VIYVHVKNLEKYQPGYTDRKAIWARIYFDSFLDAEIQKLDEINRYRYWSLIVFECHLGKEGVELNETNLKLMGWNIKKRHISLTLQMLHTLVTVRNTQPEKPVTQNRIEEKRIEEKRKGFAPPTFLEVQAYIKEKGYDVDPKKFYDYFSESGWVDSAGKKVRSWKQKIITWSGRRGEAKAEPQICIVDHRPGYKYQIDGQGKRIWLCMECSFALGNTNWGKLPKDKIERLVEQGKRRPPPQRKDPELVQQDKKQAALAKLKSAGDNLKA
jgi:hypothetical protein